MDDNVSRGSSSNDSILTSLDFEIIQTSEPQLNIAGNGNLDDLKRSLSEVLMDNNITTNMTTTAANEFDVISQNKLQKIEDSASLLACKDGERVAAVKKDEKNKEKFAVDSNKLASAGDEIMVDVYGCGIGGRVPLGSRLNDGVDASDITLYTMSSTSSDDDFNGMSQSPSMVTLPDGDECTLFHHIAYLGAATINAPKSEAEIQRNMAILNAQTSEHAIEVTLLVPSTSEGSVVLFEPKSSTEIASFKIHRIIFCARGKKDNSESTCFAFTCSHGDVNESTLFYQCHIFKCEQLETVEKVVQCFASAFRRVPMPAQRSTSEENNSSLSAYTQPKSPNEQIVMFEVSLEIKEEDAKGNFNACPKDKNCFKLRSNLLKKVVIVVQQNSNCKEMVIERCFGLLVSPGRNLKHNDMHLLENVQMSVAAAGEQKVYIINGTWDPSDPLFEVLNTETPKDTRIHMTVAVDLVLAGIQEPVRFWLETKVKIFPQNDRFWYFTRKQQVELFQLCLKESHSIAEHAPPTYDFVSLKSCGEPEPKRLTLSLNRSASNTTLPPVTTPCDPEEESDNDEPLLSGSGDVSKDCAEGELENWADVLAKWALAPNSLQRPRQLVNLVRKGIPEALRGEVWFRLMGVENSSEMMDNYRLLITKDSPCEQAIQRDINRTFPAHEYFKETGGTGQESLYKISKAYSIYDDEVGYCQGLSFLAAALLLHMPEEQAFCVLVKIMYNYQLRDLFKDNFKVLHLRFFQLEKMIEDQIPDLYNHFINMGVEAHMFGSQWFLTLFTAKFPLFLVFRILDIFVCEGMDTIFQVALALLMMSKKELLSLDFEGILKYFRVALPKRYRSEETARQLLTRAVQIKTKKLKKYEKEYEIFKEQELQLANPTERLERENKRLMEANMRLEQENDDLAHELVTSKIQLRNELDLTEDKADALNKELLSTKSLLVDTEEEKKRLEIETTQVKEMCRRELQRAESDSSRNSVIISDYKQICSQLSTRLEKEQAAAKEALGQVHAQIKDCEKCSQLIAATAKGSVLRQPQEGDPQLADALQQVRELELELAQTKLALVEAECRNQDLTHQLNAALSEIQASKNTWFHKTLSSIRDVTKKDLPTRSDSKESNS